VKNDGKIFRITINNGIAAIINLNAIAAALTPNNEFCTPLLKAFIKNEYDLSVLG
jgi:hypothetical protein